MMQPDRSLMSVTWTDDGEDSAVEAWRAAGHGRRCTCLDCRDLAGDLADQRTEERREGALKW